MSDFFRIYRGLELDDGAQFLTSTGVPGASGDSAAAPLGSVYIDKTNGDVYTKFDVGTGTDKWTLLATQEWILSNGNPEDAFMRAFVGKDGAGNEMPNYSSVTYITDGDSLETAIGKLDNSLTIVSKQTTGTGITSFTTIDSVITSMVEWNVQIIDGSDSLNRQAAKIFAIHNGTDVDFTIFGILNLGAVISGIDFDVTLSGGTTLNLRVAASTSVDVTARRITAL